MMNFRRKKIPATILLWQNAMKLLITIEASFPSQRKDNDLLKVSSTNSYELLN